MKISECPRTIAAGLANQQSACFPREAYVSSILPGLPDLAFSRPQKNLVFFKKIGWPRNFFRIY